MTNKISMDKSYTTRDGRPVRLLCVDGPESWPIVGIVGDTVYNWGNSGISKYAIGRNDDDLIEVKTKRTGWINIYDGAMTGQHIVPNKASADIVPNVKNRIACVRIEWEE